MTGWSAIVSRVRGRIIDDARVQLGIIIVGIWVVGIWVVGLGVNWLRVVWLSACGL